MKNCYYKTGFILLIISVLSFSCKDSNAIKEAEMLYSDIKKEYAPDKRVALFNVEFKKKSGKLTIKGISNLPEAKSELLKKLAAKGIEVEDSIKLLPASILGNKTYGIINVSVCNIRSKSGHSQELTTQALMGTPIRVLDQKENWFLIQTPDKYIAWLDHGGFVSADENTYKEWISAPKVLYINDFGFSYERPDKEAQKISDLVAGNILKSVGKEKGFIKVAYPDGRTAFVAEKEVLNYDTWLASRQPNAENILATAQQYLGRPYLWGGTSGKGMDCSGFTKTVFYLNGVQLARDASQQVHTGKEVETDKNLKNLLPGDLLFFGRKATKDKKERINHVGIYMGEGRFIHSSGDAGVKIENLIPDKPRYNEKRLKSFVRAKRMTTSLGENGVDLLAELPIYNASEL